MDLAEEFKEKSEKIDLRLHLQHYLSLSHLLQAHPFADRHLRTTQFILRLFLFVSFIILVDSLPNLQAILVLCIGLTHIDWLVFIRRNRNEV
jgi:prophage maintenance system killer protein